jgi:hypothetical protein
MIRLWTTKSRTKYRNNISANVHRLRRGNLWLRKYVFLFCQYKYRLKSGYGKSCVEYNYVMCVLVVEKKRRERESQSCESE